MDDKAKHGGKRDGAGAAIKKASERKPFKFPTNKRFDKYGRQN